MNAPFVNNAAHLALREEHVARGVLTVHPVVISRGEGAYVWDVGGQRYLDFVGGIDVLCVGHGHPRVVEAVKKQILSLSHACFQVVAHEPCINLAARLNRVLGHGRAFRTASFTFGAEAVA